MFSSVRWLTVFFIALLITIAPYLVVASDKNTEAILKAINEKYYHIKRAGLKDLTCTVQLSGLRDFIDTGKNQTPVQITFYWKFPDKKRVIVSCNPPFQLPDRERVEKDILVHIGNTIVSRELQEILKDTHISLEKEGNLTKLTATLPDTSEIRQYTLWIDDTYSIQKIHTVTGQGQQIVYTFEYMKKDHKLLVSQIREHYEKFDRVIHLEYTKTSGYWLISKIQTTLFDHTGKPMKQEHNTSSIQFSNYKLNTGISDHVFDKVKS